MRFCCCTLALLACLVGCRGPDEPAVTTLAVAAEPGFPAIDGQAILQHTRVLSSDEYEGRFPGTKGEELTVRYIADQFRAAGLAPGNTDGTYFQKVPLVGITPDPSMRLTFAKGGQQRRLAFKDDFVAWTKRVTETVGLDHSELVFVGYGVQAPEFGWDDFKGVDLKGKTLVVLIGDPPVPDPTDASKLDPKAFAGAGMTYYGRWSYKFEMAQRLGAAGMFIVHETGPAGYAYSVVQVKVDEQLDIARPDRNMTRAAVEGWLPLEQARALFLLAGRDLDAMKKAALSRDFKPVPLGVTASVTVHNTIRHLDSRNVIARVDGSDPALKNEYVVYSAHWDHFGIGAEIGGERVYHGAKDNAVAVAGLIEVGRAFAALPTRPKRSIVLLAVTAEEQLLLGSAYYAQNPVYPLAKTLANINLEMLNVHGPTRDLTIVGLGLSDLDDYAREVLALQGRTLRPDPEPEKGMYYRSDHFSFAREGVPALEPDEGVDFIGKPAGYAAQVRAAYIANDYHKPSDKVKPDWDLSGGVKDLQAYWLIGYRVAEAERYPEWKPGVEYRAKREAMLKSK